jgi:hypothetical protein
MKPSGMSLPSSFAEAEALHPASPGSKPIDRHREVFLRENACVQEPSAVTSPAVRRHQAVCGAFLMPGCTIGGEMEGLMAGLSCRSGSIVVIWLQALHLYT